MNTHSASMSDLIINATHNPIGITALIVAAVALVAVVAFMWLNN